MQWGHSQAAASTSDPDTDPAVPTGPKAPQHLPWHAGPGSRNWNFLLIFPAESWNNVRVVELPGGLNKHQAKAGCPGAGEEVAQEALREQGQLWGLQAGRSWIPPRGHGTHKECLKEILLLITADDTLHLSWRPPLSPLLSHNCCALSVKNLGSRAWGQDKDYATLQQGWTTAAMDMRNIPIQPFFQARGSSH